MRVRVDGHVQLGAPEPMATQLSKQRAEVVARALANVYRVDKNLIDIFWYEKHIHTPTYSLPHTQQHTQAHIQTNIHTHTQAYTYARRPTHMYTYTCI